MKTKADADLEKQLAVMNAKQKLADEFDRKEKAQAVDKRIAASKKEREERGRLLSARDALVRDLAVEAKAALAATASASGAAYGNLLKGLIKQGLHRLTGDADITVYVRPQDATIAANVAPAAAEETMRECAAAGEKRSIRIAVSVDKTMTASLGGCVLASMDGRIRCNNTLEERLNLVMGDLTPVVRDVLFPSARAQVRVKPPVSIHVGGHAPAPASAAAPAVKAAHVAAPAAAPKAAHAPAPAPVAAAGVFGFPATVAPAAAPVAADPFGGAADPFGTSSGW